MTVDVVIKNGKVVTSDGIREVGIAIKNGKIVAIAKEGKLPSAKNEIDIDGKHILPGIVDSHVHMLDMGMSSSETFATGSAAAAAGGITTSIEMPLTVPATTTLKAFEEKKQIASEKFIVDFALYGGVVPGNLEEIEKIAEAGAAGFKAMMAGSVPGLFETVNDGELLEALKEVAKCNSVLAVHAENDDMISEIENKLKSNGRKDINAFFESRPIIQELNAISRAILLAEEAGCHLHIVHVSCNEGIDMINKAKNRGQKITVETGPHYLTLSEEDGDKLGPYVKCAPPVRAKEKQNELWNDLKLGKIDTLGSDHGPHPKEVKEKGWENIFEAGNGAVMLETMLPVMLSEGVNKNKVSLETLVSVLSENPAKIFGLYPKKGTIQVGSDADLVVVDLNKKHTIKAENFYSKQKHSPYDGLIVTGMPVMTMVRGKVVMEDGEVIGEQGYGMFISRNDV